MQVLYSGEYNENPWSTLNPTLSHSVEYLFVGSIYLYGPERWIEHDNKENVCSLYIGFLTIFLNSATTESFSWMYSIT